jgi:hypothetical protein
MRTQILTAAALTCLLATPSYAQNTTAVGTGISNAESNSGALAVANNRGNGNSSLTVNNPANTTATVSSTVSGTTTQNINSSGTQRLVTSGTTTVKTAPSMVAPGLAAAGLETCLGSASGTVSAIGFGIGGGSTYADEGCQARLDSRTLFAYGLKEAAVARLCQRAQVWNSMPQVCERYWPAGMPVPAGVVYVQPGANLTMSATSGIVRVIDGRDGVEKDCLNYNAGAQKCTHWLGQAPRKRQRVANVQAPQRITVKPKPRAEQPKVVEPPKVEPAKVEPAKPE